VNANASPVTSPVNPRFALDTTNTLSNVVTSPTVFFDACVTCTPSGQFVLASAFTKWV